MRRFVSRIVGWLAVIAMTAAGVYLIVTGANMLSVQTSGTPALVTIAHCGVRHSRGNWDTCSASFPQADGTQRTVTIEGARVHAGQTVNVHIRGDHGYADGSWIKSCSAGSAWSSCGRSCG